MAHFFTWPHPLRVSLTIKSNKLSQSAYLVFCSFSSELIMERKWRKEACERIILLFYTYFFQVLCMVGWTVRWIGLIIFVEPQWWWQAKPCGKHMDRESSLVAFMCEGFWMEVWCVSALLAFPNGNNLVHWFSLGCQSSHLHELWILCISGKRRPEKLCHCIIL